MGEGPVFLAGADRSGVGLLGELLEQHPNLAIARRINFFSFYDRRFGDLGKRDNLERAVTAMMRYRRVQDLGTNSGEWLAELRAGGLNYHRLLGVLLCQYARRTGKLRWGDKSINTERYADRIFTYFPHAEMIHVIRDPRDRYASQVHHRTAGRGRVGSGAALWLSSVRWGRRNLRRYPGGYLLVRYEDLVVRPRSTLEEVCRFLEEEFSERMLLDPAHDGPRRFTDASIGRYRRDLATGDANFIELVAGRQMAHFGYGVDEKSPGRTLGSAPLNLLRMAGWWLSRRLGDSRLSPSARRLAAG